MCELRSERRKRGSQVRIPDKHILSERHGKNKGPESEMSLAFVETVTRAQESGSGVVCESKRTDRCQVRKGFEDQGQQFEFYSGSQKSLWRVSSRETL